MKKTLLVVGLLVISLTCTAPVIASTYLYGDFTGDNVVDMKDLSYLSGLWLAEQRFFEERNFVRGRRVQVVSQRNTLAVDHHHPLRSLAAFGLSDVLAPFFAGAKLPSANASLQSNCPRWSSSERKARHASSQMSCSSQFLSRLQQVDGLGNCFGKSAQGAPVRSIQRMPTTASLSNPGTITSLTNPTVQKYTHIPPRRLVIFSNRTKWPIYQKLKLDHTSRFGILLESRLSGVAGLRCKIYIR